MRTVIYMAISIDGFIEKDDGETPWSDEEWKSYSEAVREAGNLIIGRKTYEIMVKKEFANLDNPFVVVVSNNVIEDVKGIIVNSPEQAVKLVEEKGFETALVAGGSLLNTSFLEKNLVDEIVLDIESLIFGTGTKLILNKLDKKLDILDVKNKKSFIQIRYKVLE